MIIAKCAPYSVRNYQVKELRAVVLHTALSNPSGGWSFVLEMGELVKWATVQVAHGRGQALA